MCMRRQSAPHGMGSGERCKADIVRNALAVPATSETIVRMADRRTMAWTKGRKMSVVGKATANASSHQLWGGIAIRNADSGNAATSTHSENEGRSEDDEEGGHDMQRQMGL